MPFGTLGFLCISMDLGIISTVRLVARKSLMHADNTYGDKGSCKHLDHHRNSKKGLAEETRLFGVDIAYSMKRCTLDNEE